MGTRRATIAGRILDQSNPINWKHPLNVGLLSNWAVVPPIMGGGTLLDLCRKNNGVLTNAPGWAGASPGGYGGSLSFVAGTNNVNFGNYLGLSGATALTISFRIFYISGSGRIVQKWGVTSTDQAYLIALTATGKIECALFKINEGYQIKDTTTSLVAGVWTHVTVTFVAPTTMAIYLNGNSDALTSVLNQSVSSITAGTTNLELGYETSDAANPAVMLINQLQICNRALLAAECKTLYTESQVNNPNLWNWLSTRSYFGVQAAVTGIAFDAASNSGYQSPASTYSWSHTCTGTNRFLTVDISLLSVPGTTVSGITYNGVAMSLIGVRSSVSGAARVECWGLKSPATGSNTIAVTLSASVASSGAAVSYTGVNQTEQFETFNSAQATNVGAADATVTITPVSDNCWIHAAVASDDTSITAGQTTRNNVTGALGSGANEDTGPITPAAAQAMTYTGVGALATWVIAGYAIIPVEDAAIPPSPFYYSLLGGAA